MSIDLSTVRLSKKAQRRILVAWLAAALLGLAGLQLLSARERERDRHHWEVQLGLVASAHGKAVGGWVEDRRTALRNLASNVSLKLYLTELAFSNRKESDIATEPAELTYLRNLLIASAELGGFSSPAPEMETLGVSAAPEYGAGLALMRLSGESGKLIAATRAMPPHTLLPQIISQDTDHLREPLVSPVFELAPGKPAIAFRVPVLAVQADSDAFPLGFVVGVALLDEAFYSRLLDVTDNEKTAESLLIEPQGALLRYLSPLQDGKKPMELTVDKDSPLATPSATRAPGVLVEAQDYRSNSTLAIARPVEGTSWLVVRKIDAEIALHDTNARTVFFRVAYILGVALISAGGVALWRNATALRAWQVAQHYKSLLHRIQKQEALLELIAETTPIATYIVDEQGKYRYANRHAAEDAEMERDALIGKNLEGVLGGGRGRRLQAANAEALSQDAPQLLRQREEQDGILRSVRESRHLPLTSLPLTDESSEHAERGVLVIDQDVTDIVRGEERRAATLRQLIATLVEMVDRRDPHAARHSACVALLARQVGKQMQLDETMIHTAEVAGQLMNIGKIAVPENLLTAKDALKEKDRDRIRASILASVDLLAGVEFDGPVVDTLRQSLTNNPHLVSARIIATVNDFVAMISPRAWRSSRKMDDAIAEMLKQAGGRYERAVVGALVNYLDNAGGRKAVEDCLKRGT